MNRSSPIDSSVIAKTYNRYFLESNRLKETDAFYLWVLNRLQVKQGKQLLDIACGEGNLGRISAARGLKTFCIDISSEALKVSRHNTPTNQINIADGQSLPFPSASFDYATNLGSLEHFTNPNLGLAEIYRVLRVSGKAAILVPNSYYLVDILWTVLRTGYPPSHDQLIERFATYHEWRNLIEAANLCVDAGYKYNFAFPRSWDDVLWYLDRPRKLLNLSVAPFIPFHLSYSFLFIVSKANPKTE